LTPDTPEPAAEGTASKGTERSASADKPTLATESPLADRNQRDLIRTALDATLVVEAAAGTGKTTELVRRMVAMIAGRRAELDRVVAVTFTDAAAGELKLRLRAAIEEARLDESRPSEERYRLTAALPKLEEARIGTIHSFCADLLRERPVEAGVDPRFEVAANDVARPLFERAFGRWFETQLAEPGPAVRRILRRWKREPAFGSRRRDEGPRALLRQAAWQLVEHRDFPAPWRHATGFDRDPEIDSLLEDMEALAEWAPRSDPEDWFGKSLIAIAKAVDEVRRAERVRERDHDALEAWLGELVRPRNRYWGWKGWARSGDPDFPRDELRRRRDELYARLKQFVDDAGADLAPQLRDELWPVVEAYEAAKERAGCLDFNDLLIRARDLIRDHAQVRHELQRRFTHYFVDEFQDTDPLQVEILMLLAADDPAATLWPRARAVPGKLFLVGDPKQSIYRFRRADVTLYREVQRRLVEQGATLVHLTVSFRSVPEIQEAVNAAFAPRLGGADGSSYVPLARYRESHDAQPAVIALPVPAPYGDFRKVVEWRIEESLPDVIAAWIDWLVNESGWTVSERERPGERVNVEPRHVCLLFRRFKSFGDDVTGPYVGALEARQLPHLLVGGSSFHDREEIETLRNALGAVDRPDDELAVFATLRGPLLAVSDAALLTWRESVGNLHPFRPVPEDLPPSLAEVAESLSLLRDLHRGRNRRPVADTIARLLEATRAHAAFAIWPTGMQALANVGRLMDLARRAEQKGLVSFRGFVEQLEDEAERGEVAEAPLLEEGVEGVRIMTAHKAKGLEFPVVVLADMTAKATLEQPTRWSDPARGLCVQRLAGCTPPELRDHANEEMEREQEEAVRLLYVASTRARDVLVAPVIGDERHEGWLAALHPAVHPQPPQARHPAAGEAPGCPKFGDDSVPGRPGDVMRPGSSVMPGSHRPEAGTHRVVWWDPAVLRLRVRPSIGLSQTRILEADSTGHASAAMSSWETWRAARFGARQRGGKPSRVVRAATEWAYMVDEVLGSDKVDVVDVGWQGERPRGRRFGTLIHALLAVAGLDDDRAAIATHASVQARLLGASEAEREVAIEVSVAALAHPLLRRAAAAARQRRCRREAAIVIRLEDGMLLEGIVDLAFEEDGAWMVLDFKTDGELAGRLESYKRQVALYARGIAEATGAPVHECLLRV
jgi:ATP-dependent exoDNAse (exonuclease V) beta subunit